jgi:hypothetical protein
MNLGPRCEKMLQNRMQCPNTAQLGSIYCELHNKLAASATTIKDVNITDKEPNAK